jgi:hypothetical protein
VFSVTTRALACSESSNEDMMRSMFVNPKMNRIVNAVEMTNAFERILDLRVNA